MKMKLLSVNRARSIWVGNLGDLNPRGYNLLKVFPRIINKYNFQKYPTDFEEIDPIQGIKFLAGTFINDKKHDITIELNIFNWGLVAETRSSTDDSDSFLDEFLSWIAMEIELVAYQQILKTKFYLSELWVQFNKNLNALNPKLAEFTKRLTSMIEGHEHHPIKFETSGIAFWTDPNIVGPPGPFRFERAENASFSENRYYSSAPLQTETHLEILDELEDLLSS
jgi:hypothetical protein